MLTIRPNFFIVGCPKCATTSMHRYLKAHPQIYMPETKELHYFGRDIHSVLPYTACTLREYLKMFKYSNGYPMRGEASIYYIYSKYAAEEIYSFNRNAKIIIMIREPIEMIYALHYHYLFNQWCDEPDFGKILDLQEKELDKEKIRYRSLVKRLPENIRKFQSLFGPQNVKVVRVDEFKQNTAAIYKETLEFLGVDSRFKPENFEIHNRNKEPRTKLAGRLMGQGSGSVSAVRDLVWKSSRLYQMLYKFRYFLFFKLNAKEVDRPKMSPELRAALEEEFRPYIKELEEITKQDLSSWYVSEC